MTLRSPRSSPFEKHNYHLNQDMSASTSIICHPHAATLTLKSPLHRRRASKDASFSDEELSQLNDILVNDSFDFFADQFVDAQHLVNDSFDSFPGVLSLSIESATVVPAEEKKYFLLEHHHHHPSSRITASGSGTPTSHHYPLASNSHSHHHHHHQSQLSPVHAASSTLRLLPNAFQTAASPTLPMLKELTAKTPSSVSSPNLSTIPFPITPKHSMNGIGALSSRKRPAARCSFGECHNRARSRGLCKKHGGGKRCSHEGCTRPAQCKGLCPKHGGATRCKMEGCPKFSQSLGLCKAHGGGTLCAAHGCKKNAHQNRYCRTHGGGIRCKFQGCFKWAQKSGFCCGHTAITAAMSNHNHHRRGVVDPSTGIAANPSSAQ